MPTLGESVRHAAERISNLAAERGEVIEETFNGLPLIAAPGWTAHQVIGDHVARAKARRIAWLETPEGREFGGDTMQWEIDFLRACGGA